MARIGPTQADIRETEQRLVKGVIDWPSFVRMAKSHGVAAVVRVNAGLIGGVPEEVTAALRKCHLYNVKDAEVALNELMDIMERLAGHGIDSIPLKGVIASQELLGDAALYPSADIDLLVRRRDICEVTRVMSALGYGPVRDPFDGSYAGRYHEIAFQREGRKSVDCHYAPVNPKYFDIPEKFWWEDLREVSVRGRTVRLLSVEKNFIFLSLHLFQHGYTPLKSLLIFAELLRTQGDKMDWDRIWSEYVEAHDLYHPVALSLYLARRLFGASPGGSLRGCRRKAFLDKYIYGKVESYIFREDVRLSKVLFLLSLLQYGPGGALLRALRWTFPHREEIAFRYNLPVRSKKVCLYYLLNPFLLFSMKRAI